MNSESLLLEHPIICEPVSCGFAVRDDICQKLSKGDKSQLTGRATRGALKSTSKASMSGQNAMKLRIRTLHCGEITLSSAEAFSSYRDIKVAICKQPGCPLQPDDLMLICNGCLLRDDDCVDVARLVEMNCKLYVLVKTTSKTIVNLTFKGEVSSSSSPNTLSVTASSRVFHLRKLLLSKKITTLKTGAQRIIIGSRVLDDSFLLGDYLLKCKLSSSTASATSANATTTSATTANATTKCVLAYLLKQENLKHEVDVLAPLPNGNTMKFSFEISAPVSSMREALWRIYHVPKDVELILALKRARAAASESEYVTLDPNLTLLDYGVTNEFKSVEISITRIHTISGE